MKKISISIPKPCHENWEVMTPEGKGKFCGPCQKTVIDFSVMNDRQLAEFFKKPHDSLCGRFMPDQLDRAILLPQKRIPWIRYFFTIAIPAFLVSCKFVGRQALQGKVQNFEKLITGDTILVEPLSPPPPPVVGRLVESPFDSAVKPASKREFIVSAIKKCKVEAIAKDSSFRPIPFDHQPIKIERSNNTPSAPANVLEGIMGGISISGIKAYKEKASMPLVETKHSLSPAPFSVYPNPASSGSIITLNTKSFEHGPYTISVINSGGSVIQISRVDFWKGTRQFQITLKSMAAGTYLVMLTDTKSGQRFTETLLVQ